MKSRGITEDRLELLKGVSGSFRPGVLTALIGVSGARKTTLMDVLVGRKTGGYIDKSITISGHMKNQETFARIFGYCKQIVMVAVSSRGRSYNKKGFSSRYYFWAVVGMVLG